ncbi:hypothetical protein VTL71DRAFT_16333 [Oculimacula yallundae]|uniref:Uncharacterized protein n=1 Tax=Oculimacula yallundae TaxID=86028 RepID=A0ABR4CE66_9HELO
MSPLWEGKDGKEEDSTSDHLSDYSQIVIASFNKRVAYDLVNFFDSTFDLPDQPGGFYGHRYVSESLQDKMRFLDVEGLEPAEKLIKSELDNLKPLPVPAICSN